VTPTPTPVASTAPDVQIPPATPRVEPVAASPAEEPEPLIVPRPDQPEPPTAAPIEPDGAAPAPAPEPAPVPPSAMVPNEPSGPAAVVGQVVGAAVEQVVRAVRPEAAVAVATEFTFPLALALAVLAYLVIQGPIDRRDPKLRGAPQNVIETLVTFKTEEEL
jgi:hypothetical protein